MPMKGGMVTAGHWQSQTPSARLLEQNVSPLFKLHHTFEVDTL